MLNVGNPSRFRLVYHISEYKNINLNARKANIYNFTQIITRYETQAFIEDATKILSILNSILSMLSSDAIHHVPFEKTVSNLPFPLKTIINMVRHSAFPTELKEEIYLHLITWRNGKNGGNDEVIRLLPAITMYLKPPLELEKYLVAAILDNEGVDITEMPLCLTTNLKDPKPDQSMLRLQDEAFV